jgi:hypothetical protein
MYRTLYRVYARFDVAMIEKKLIMIQLIGIPLMALTISLAYIQFAYASENSTRSLALSELNAALNDALRAKAAAERGDLNTATQLEEDAEASLDDAMELIQSDPELLQQLEEGDIATCAADAFFCLSRCGDIAGEFQRLGCRIDCLIDAIRCVIDVIVG